jgi:hypothetical protein
MIRRRLPRTRANKPQRRRHEAEPAAEVEQLRLDLAAAHQRLLEMEGAGADAYTQRRLADLDEARLVARGQALDAAAARAKAEAELRALRDAIGKAPGLAGWLLRRARRKAGLP